jgi:hypothetical protein
METARAEEASHLFFGNALRPPMFSMMATHPPLEDRIKRIDPTWDGEFPKVHLDTNVGYQKVYGQQKPSGSSQTGPRRPPRAAAGMVGLTGAALAGQVGAPEREHVEYASKLLQQIPEDLRNMAHEPDQARALVYSLLLSPDPSIRKNQMGLLRANAETGVLEDMESTSAKVSELKPEHRLPLADMTIPALRRLSEAQYERFRGNVDRLILADEQIDLFEYALQRLLLQHLDTHFGRHRPPRIRHYSLESVKSECAVVLSTLAQIGTKESVSAERAFREAVQVTQLTEMELMPRQLINLDRLNSALNELAASAAQVKRVLIEACSACILVDNRITIEESELLRAISDFLGCPMPPVLAQ